MTDDTTKQSYRIEWEGVEPCEKQSWHEDAVIHFDNKPAVKVYLGVRYNSWVVYDEAILYEVVASGSIQVREDMKEMDRICIAQAKKAIEEYAKKLGA